MSACFRRIRTNRLRSHERDEGDDDRRARIALHFTIMVCGLMIVRSSAFVYDCLGPQIYTPTDPSRRQQLSEFIDKNGQINEAIRNAIEPPYPDAVKAFFIYALPSLITRTVGVHQ